MNANLLPGTVIEQGVSLSAALKAALRESSINS